MKFDAYVKKGTLLHNYAHIFELLSRLRQAVNHPHLVGGLSLPKVVQEATCGICHEIGGEDVATAGCGHLFHKTCILQYVQALPPGGKLKCPVCHTNMTIDLEEEGQR